MTSNPTSLSVDRKRRQRRAVMIEALQSTLSALERAVPVMLTLDSDESDGVQWEGFLDADAMRVRRLMRQSLELTREARQLQSAQWQIKRLLHEHRLATRVVFGLLHAGPVDDWAESVRRWRQLTRTYFTPWAMDECVAEADKALKELNALLWSPDTHTTGASFLGWRDRRRMDRTGHQLQFVFLKDFYGFDMMHSVDTTWAAYNNAKAYQHMIMGDNARSAVDIVQQLSPTMRIIRYDEQYATLTPNVHMLYLVFRVENERGFTHCMRSIQAPEIQKAMEGSNDLWATNFVWFKWEPLDDELRDYRLFVGGSIAGNDANYANRWLIEVLASLIRGETMITRRPLLPSSSSSP